MDKSATIKVKDLTPPAREWIRSVLHIDLTEEDEVAVSVRRPVRTPAPEQRAAARRSLLEVLDRIAERTKDVPEAEINEAIEEALAHVRSHPH
jgi:hypothetical protein